MSISCHLNPFFDSFNERTSKEIQANLSESTTDDTAADLTDSNMLSNEDLLKTMMQLFQLEFLEHEFTQNEMKVNSRRI